jgi:tetratricopeptide (TPR) repeat protein
MFHDRVRDAVLKRLTPAELRERHVQLAQALAASDRTDPEALARHFRAGGDAARAARYSVLAAERASAAFAFDRAVALYRVALDLAAPDERGELQVRLADALVNAGRGADAAEAYLAAVKGTDRRRAIDLRRRAAEHFLRSGRVDQGVATLRGVLSEVGLPMPASPRRVLVSIIGARLRLWLRGLSVRLRDERDVAPDVLLRTDTCA